MHKWIRAYWVYMGKRRGNVLWIDLLWISVALRIRSRKEIRRAGKHGKPTTFNPPVRMSPGGSVIAKGAENA